MSKGTLNKVMLIGRLGADPEIRYMPGGTAAVSLSLATNESYKDKTGQMVENTEWHKVSFIGKLAEVLGEWAKKGNLLYVEGRIKTRKWQDSKTQQTRYMTEIAGDHMQFLGGRGEGGPATAAFEGAAKKNKSVEAQDNEEVLEFAEASSPFDSAALSPMPEKPQDDDIPF